jgi:uncharacterized linocin/CFP29 family protein
MAEVRQLVGLTSESARPVDKLVEKPVHETIQGMAVLRRVVPLGPVYQDAASIPYPRIQNGKIQSGQVLVPVLLRAVFQVQSEQERDEAAIVRLAVGAARRIAQAEDAVILFGDGAKPQLKRWQVEHENLNRKEGLLGGARRNLAGKVLDGVAKAVDKLVEQGQGNCYRAVVSSALFNEAHKAKDGAIPLDQIRALLRDERFERSALLDPGRRGVVMCITGQPVDLAFTNAPSVKYQRHVKGAVEWAIVERFALRILEADAVRSIPA